MVLWAVLIGRPAVEVARATDVCTSGCLGDVRTCVHAGAAAKLACRVECKSADGHAGACLRECRAAFRAERTTCRTVGRTCAADCAPADGDDDESGTPPDPACPGHCGAALGRCLHDAAGGMPACLQGCEKGRERHACVQECLATAKDGQAQCHAEHDACLGGCGGATSTTTSTTVTSITTTTIPIPLCGDAAAPTCDGDCPEVTQVCTEIEPGVCGCTGGSASAAFTKGMRRHR
jgi:hypothetical protein